ncbi:nucleoside triphosphate pyrophosphohydrolase [Porphyrobacter sp. GA68]|nr:nucleoside triphosphate pyrophosphohydrolase [Porphyrobacter sp. GA68]
MRRLRDPDTGCTWDLAQDFASVAPYTIEEAYEVADAIDRADVTALKEELGDLLLQVVYHAQIAAEAGAFSFADVAAGITAKMIARHPHVFDTKTHAIDSGMTDVRWEELKHTERADKGADSSMDGVARALPALMRAQKLQKRAARDGFDWPNVEGPLAKLHEEIDEFTAAPDDTARAEEAGDLLFAAVNLLRAYGIDGEQALRSANEKFERRYRAMEELAADAFSSLSLEEQEALWQSVKLREQPGCPSPQVA